MSLGIMPMSTSFAPRNDGTSDKRPDFLKKLVPAVGCDLPEQGGISGNMKVGKNDKPHPIAKEERPTVYDWRTGEMVYKDKLPKPHVCYIA